MTTFCEPPDTDAGAADIKLTTPADLLSAIPYLLGYVPSDSLVLVGMDGKSITMTLRIDLPPAGRSACPPTVNAAVLRRNRVAAAVIAGYGPAQRVTGCIDQVRRLLRAENIELVDALRVTDGRYWSYVCQEPACCPPAGKPVNPAASTVDAVFTYNGMRALPHRDAVTAQLEPVTGALRAAVTRATNRVLRFLDDTDGMFPARDALRDEAHAILDKATAKGTPLPDVEETVRLAAMLSDTKLHTEALAFVDNRGPHKNLDLWLWVTRHVAPAFRAVPAALLGFAAWRCGNGVLAAEAVRRSLNDDPRCRLAVTLGRLLDRGTPPASIPALVDHYLAPLRGTATAVTE